METKPAERGVDEDTFSGGVLLDPRKMLRKIFVSKSPNLWAAKHGLNLPRWRQQTAKLATAQGEENAHLLYDFQRTWHFRGLTAFAVSQILYWSFLSYEHLTAEPKKKPEYKLEAEPGKRNPKVILPRDNDIFVQFYTHPAWCFMGAAVSIGCGVLLHLYSKNLISRIVLLKKGYNVEVYTHNILGGLSPQKKFSVRNFVVDPPSGNKSGYLLVSVPGQTSKLLLDRNGKYFPLRAGIEGQEAQEISALRSIGVSWTDFGGSVANKATQSSTYSSKETSGQRIPPTLSELRKKRISLTRNK